MGARHRLIPRMAGPDYVDPVQEVDLQNPRISADKRVCSTPATGRIRMPIPRPPRTPHAVLPVRHSHDPNRTTSPPDPSSSSTPSVTSPFDGRDLSLLSRRLGGPMRGSPQRPFEPAPSASSTLRSGLRRGTGCPCVDRALGHGPFGVRGQQDAPPPSRSPGRGRHRAANAGCAMGARSRSGPARPHRGHVARRGPRPGERRGRSGRAWLGRRRDGRGPSTFVLLQRLLGGPVRASRCGRQGASASTPPPGPSAGRGGRASSSTSSSP